MYNSIQCTSFILANVNAQFQSNVKTFFLTLFLRELHAIRVCAAIWYGKNNDDAIDIYIVRNKNV